MILKYHMEISKLKTVFCVSVALIVKMLALSFFAH